MTGDELFTQTRTLIPKLTKFVYSDTKYDEDGISLSNNQCNLILGLLAHPERTMSELGIRSNIKKSTMTGLVHSLEKTRIITRLEDEEDRRKTKLKLTDLGLEIGYKLRIKIKTTFLNRKSMLNDDDQLNFESCIDELTKIMDKLKELDNGQN